MKPNSLPLFAVLTLAAALAQAAPPDAGQILQQLTPAPQLPPPKAPQTTVEERPTPLPGDGQRILVEGFRIGGATAFSEAELLALIDDAAGRELNLGELDTLAARITRHYRDAGYLVARAYLPPQDVKGGIVTLAVSEGRVGEVRVDNRAGIAASALAPLDKVVPGEAVSALVLERSLLSLSDLPGVEVKSTLRPGAAVGTSDLLVEVAPGPAFSGSVDADTFGNRYTGAARLGTSLFWNNPAGLGDQASLRLQASEDHFTYSRAGYQLPVGPYATRIGAAWSEMRYRLGKDFAALKADGEATVGSLYLLHPFLRSRQANWYGQLQYEGKHLVDRIGATATETAKDLRNYTIGINGNFQDGLGGGGNNTVSLAHTRGHLGLDATSAVVDAATAHSRGDFGKWSAGYQRTQRLPADWVLGFSYSGQWAGKNLDSSEKFSLGGAHGVRAYPQGEASGDEAQLVSLELRHYLSPNWEAQGFYDDGQVTMNRNPWTTSANHRRLAGYGLGANYMGGGYTVRLFVAWKTGTDKPASDVDRSPRIWLQAATYF
jgi:hemolysin activation/secretion protein